MYIRCLNIGRNKSDKEGDKDEPGILLWCVGLHHLHLHCALHSDGYLIPASSLVLGTRLGEGGFGTVYLSDLNGTLVAVKQLKLDKSADVDHMNEVKALRFVHLKTVYYLVYTYFLQ